MNENLQDIMIAKTNSNDSNDRGSQKEFPEINDINEQSKRMQKLMEEVSVLQDPVSRELMEACIREILTFYGNGLGRILHILSEENSTAATRILNRFIEDPFISGLLLIHDLHPFDLNTRLRLALEKVRPYMDSHGGNVEIISLENGIAKLKLTGTCKSCASSSVTLELAIKEAIEENCPDLLGLDVEGVTPGVSNETFQKASACNHGTTKWKIIGNEFDLSDGAMKFLDLNGIPVMICKTSNHFYAYRNNCPACDLPLSTGNLSEGIITCRLGHGYEILHAGICVDDPSLHLDPFPLLVENGIVKISAGQS